MPSPHLCVPTPGTRHAAAFTRLINNQGSLLTPQQTRVRPAGCSRPRGAAPCGRGAVEGMSVSQGHRALRGGSYPGRVAGFPIEEALARNAGTTGACVHPGRETWAPACVAAGWRLPGVTSQGCRWAGGTSMGNRLHDAWAGWG